MIHVYGIVFSCFSVSAYASESNFVPSLSDDNKVMIYPLAGSSPN